MSREIKFRGFCIDWQEWIYGDLIRFSDTIMVCVANKEDNFSQTGKCHCDVYEETVGQYIGVDDKNRKEIYEKDIARVDGKQELFVVMWVPDTARFGLQSKDELLYFEFGIGSRIEVIGNVYENADLLKEAGNE